MKDFEIHPQRIKMLIKDFEDDTIFLDSYTEREIVLDALNLLLNVVNGDIKITRNK